MHWALQYKATLHATFSVKLGSVSVIPMTPGVFKFSHQFKALENFVSDLTVLLTFWVHHAAKAFGSVAFLKCYKLYILWIHTCMFSYKIMSFVMFTYVSCSWMLTAAVFL